MKNKKVLLCVLALTVALIAMSAPALAANVARIESTEYATLDAAAMALQNGSGTIVLLDDITVNSNYAAYFMGATVTLDLAGHTITNTKTAKNSAALYLLNTSMTIIDSVGGGKVIGSANKDATSNWWSTVYLQQGSTLTVEAGSIESDGTAPAVTFAKASQTVTVDGGNVESILLKHYADTVTVTSGSVGTIEDLGTNTNVSTVTVTGGDVENFDLSPVQNVDIPWAAEINGTKYATLPAAIAAVPTNGTQTTIKLLKNVPDGSGFKTASGQNVVIDFGGHSYNAGAPTVGSSGTETNGLQLLKGSTVTLKNGTLYSDAAKILIQNYSDLTLENMNVGRAEDTYAYTVSNNFGSMTATGDTNITAVDTAYNNTDGVAFDVWYGMFADYDEGIEIVFDDDFTGTVTGKVEYGAANRAKNVDGWEDNASIEISGGNFDIEYVASNGNDLSDANIEISGGTFTAPVPAEYCALDFAPEDNGNGQYIVAPVTLSVKISAQDAFVDYSGTGNLRFVSTISFTSADTISYYGTWFIPEDLLGELGYESRTVTLYDPIASGSSFNADLLNIPAGHLSRSIAGVSFVKAEGQEEISTAVATASVDEIKNYTSAY